MTLRVACVQLNAGPEIAPNLAAAERLIRDAAAQGARFIATPENTCHIRAKQISKLETALTEDTHPALPLFAALARELGVWLLVGSLSIRLPGDRFANRSFLFDDTGAVAARYDKIHLFDVDLPTGESHRESDMVRPGDAAVVAAAPFAHLGFSICYDLRFAYLYRALAQAGANLIAVPAAFTVPTGKAHWEVLLRARAIETGAFVIAPAQCGEHEGGRLTYGHSLIVGPWGDVIARADDTPGIILADIDLADSAKARQAIPALRHDRPFSTA